MDFDPFLTTLAYSPQPTPPSLCFHDRPQTQTLPPLWLRGWHTFVVFFRIFQSLLQPREEAALLLVRSFILWLLLTTSFDYSSGILWGGGRQRKFCWEGEVRLGVDCCVLGGVAPCVAVDIEEWPVDWPLVVLETGLWAGDCTANSFLDLDFCKKYGGRYRVHMENWDLNRVQTQDLVITTCKCMYLYCTCMI